MHTLTPLPHSPMPSKHFTSPELAALVGVGTNTVGENARKGFIPSFIERGDYRFTDQTVGEIVRLGWLRYLRKRKAELGIPLRRKVIKSPDETADKARLNMSPERRREIASAAGRASKVARDKRNGFT